DAPGVTVTATPALDPTRTLATITFTDAPATRIGTGEPAVLRRRLREIAWAALAAEQVGAARHCLEMTVEYTASRVQFGRPIGSFQAVKHLCAEMLLDLESARAAALHAAAVAGGTLAEAAAVAKVCCSEAYVRIAADSLHVHGGLGFTWDHDAHLYLRRARSSLHLFGDPRFHRERLARHLGL
ncbi:MAG: acyl-CoA dehydrogenase family protein, partial [Acidimicrobiales bacterium]|nr:acyl-CoA dehydrogenase family protein [Acidimicrobiales bacterium]